MKFKKAPRTKWRFVSVSKIDEAGVTDQNEFIRNLFANGLMLKEAVIERMRRKNPD